DGKVVTPIEASSATLQVTGTQVHATTGQAFTGLVATITGADPKATTASFTVAIDWGNGTTSAGTISIDSKGGFDVMGSNTYGQAGAYTATVMVRDQTAAVVGKDQTKVSVAAPAQPTQTLDPKGTVLWATGGKEFSGVVASFNDSRAAAAAGDFTITINWGDGTSSAGTVTGDSQNGFAIN